MERKVAIVGGAISNRTPEELKRLKEDMERVRKWVQRKFH